MDGTSWSPPISPHPRSGSGSSTGPTRCARQAGSPGSISAAGTEPPFPAFAWSAADPDELLVTEMIMDCNWMQVLEGSIDSSHVGVLHLDTLATRGPARAASARSTSPGNRGTWICRYQAGAGKAARARLPAARGLPSDDNAPRIEVENTPFGFHYAAIRDVTGEPDRKFVPVTAFVMPYTAFIGGAPARDRRPARRLHLLIHGVFPVPKGPAQHGGRARGRTRRSGARAGQPRDPAAAPGPRGDGGQPSFAGSRRQPDPGRRGPAVVRPDVRPRQGTPGARRSRDHQAPAAAGHSVRLLEAGQDPVGRGEGCDFARITTASQIIDASQAWGEDLVPAHQGSAS